MTIGVGVIGYGYWGPNLMRNFDAAQHTRVVAVADRSPSRRAAAAESAAGLAVLEDADDLLRRDDVDAVVVATPVSTHYALACAALERGKHVLVEKPICRTEEEAVDLIARAARAGRVLMVDHTFLFTGAVQTMAGVVGRGELGKICYFDSVRVNLGLFQPDVNCLWDLAPHDLSIIDHLAFPQVVGIEASGYCHLDPLRPDMVFLTMHYADDSVAHFNLSWMSPVKVRRFTIGGTRKMLVWDDLDQDQKIKIYDHGIEYHPEEQRASITPSYRIGDILSPQISRKEALRGVAEHFAEVILGSATSIMDGTRALRVVRLLEWAERELARSLEAVARRRRQAQSDAAEEAR